MSPKRYPLVIERTSTGYSAYSPEKLSMEKTESMFTPADRIGALEMQNLNLMDSRNLLIELMKNARLTGKDFPELLE